MTAIQIHEPDKLYKIGPDYKYLSTLNLKSNEIIPKTVVVSPNLIDIWLKKVAHIKYESIVTRLDEYTIDFPGLLPIKAEYIEFKILNTKTRICKSHVEEALEQLVDIYESEMMGKLRSLRLFKHNLLLTPEIGSQIISQLQPHLEECETYTQIFNDQLNNISHPNLMINKKSKE